MVNVSIDVTDLGGEARPGDKVVFWRPRMGGSATHAGRVISTAPVTVFLTDGKATVSDVEPGEMTVLLQCRGVESQGPVTVGVPDGDHTVTLRALLESQFEYAPPIVSAVQEAASNASASEEAAIQAQIRSEAAADRAEDRVDEAINNGAELVRDEVKQDADRAVSARQAATQSESNAAASESAAATSESNAAASESAAKQSETNAGDYAAVATTAATEAVDAMDSVSDIIGANYATREYVDAAKWGRPRLANTTDINTLTFEQHRGAYPVGTRNDATLLGLPLPNQGVFTVHWLAGESTPVTIQTWEPYTGERLVRFLPQGGMWSQWINKSAEDNWTRGTLPDGADLNELDTPFGEQGAHGLSSSNTYLNSPFQGRNGSVLVIANGFGQVTQLAWEYASQSFYMRTIRNFYSSPKTWNDWEQVALQSWVTQQIQDGLANVEIKPKVVPQGADLTDVSREGRLAPGLWSVTSSAHAESLTGLPPGVGTCSFQQWPYNPAAAASTRLLLGAGNTGVWYQSLGGMNAWQPWVRLDGPSEEPPKETPSTHGARREALRRAKGNVIGTAGKGVVALRFDHNIDAFNSLILPELVARDLPATQCHYVEELTAEPSTSSWAEIQDVAIRHGVEAWSHGRTHQDATGYDAIRHELIDAKDDLEAAMPLLEIPGLIVPGVTGTKFDGWSANLSSPKSFTDWEAGRLVAAKYASCDGHGGLLTSPGTSLGWQSYFVDSQTSATAAKGLIDEAADTGTIAVIALHANRVNASGGIPLAVYREILDHIVTLRNSGLIEVLTVAGATVADPGTSWRQEICRPLTSWSLGSGWTRDADGLHGTGPTGTAALAVNSSRYNWGGGHVWEAWVDVEGAGSVELRLTLNTQQIDITRTLSGGGRIRVPFTIPKGEASVSMRLTVTDGAATIAGAGIHAV